MPQDDHQAALELEAKPIQQVVRDWTAASLAEAAELFQRTFTQASVLPSMVVLEEAQARAETWSGRVPVALVAVNDLWSIYAVTSALLAVSAEHGRTMSLTSLTFEDARELGLPGLEPA